MLSHNLYGRPIYFGDMIDSISPWNKMERMREIEEKRRRQAALERAYRERVIQEEQELQKEILKYKKQQQQKQEWKRYQQQQKQQQEILRQQQQQQMPNDDETSGSELQYRLVLGPDGYLYRIPIKQEKMMSSVKDESQKMSTTSPDVACHVVENKFDAHSVSPLLSASSIKIIVNEINSNRFITDEEKEPLGTLKANNVTSKSMNGGKSHNVLVEDASDSESEDDDWKSIWRNRLPSPGEWMEPVQNVH